MKHILVNKLKEKRGVALMTVVLFFIVTSIFFGSLVFVSINNANNSSANSRSISAFYAAEAGLNMIISEITTIKNNVSIPTTQLAHHLELLKSDSIFNGEVELRNSSTFEIVFKSWSIQNNVLTTRVESTGRSKGFARTLATEITFDFSDVGNTISLGPILVNKNITVNNGSIVCENPSQCKSATNSTNKNDVTSSHQGSTTFNARFTMPDFEDEFENIRSRVDAATQPLGNQLNAGTLQGGNYFVDHLDFSKLNISEINVESDVLIKTNKITLGSVHFKGEGDVIIYVTKSPNQLSFLPYGRNNDKSPDFGRVSSEKESKLVIYVDEMQNQKEYHVTFENGSITRAFLIFVNARIQFEQGSTFYGGLFTGAENTNQADAVSLGQRTSFRTHDILPYEHSLIVAPNGTVSFQNNASLKGTVIANSFVLGQGGGGSNNTSVTFDGRRTLMNPFKKIILPSTNGSSSVGRNRSLSFTSFIEQ